ALLDSELLQGIGGLADLSQEVGVRQRLRVARLADPVVCDLVAAARLDLLVQTLVGDIQLAADEPLREREVPLEGGLERLRPGDPFAPQALPERDRIRGGLLVD